MYAPGSSPDNWPEGMAKFVPAGSDLVFQMHYMAHGRATSDQSSIGMIFANHPPKQRVLTLQLTNDRFVIPPGVDDYRVEVHGSLPNDAVLLSFFPHMHLRGKRFEYNILRPNESAEPLLRVNYNFYWQLSYRLAEPLRCPPAPCCKPSPGTTTPKIIRTIPIQTPPSAGAIKPTMK